jgi:hypothetical protein
MDERLQALLDKQEIGEVLARYMRAVDRGDLDTLRACYLPGATEEHGGVYSGDAQSYVDGIAQTLTHPRALTTHCLSNVLIELDGDTARVECYVTAFARVKTPQGKGDTLTVARMVDDFARHEGRWGIAHRQLLWEWNHDMDVTEGWIFGMLVADTATLQHGGKYPSDPVYRPAVATAGGTR